MVTPPPPPYWWWPRETKRHGSKRSRSTSGEMDSWDCISDSFEGHGSTGSKTYLLSTSPSL